MTHETSTAVRLRLLSNGAAEYLETRAHESLGLELAGSESLQYEPLRDRFIAKDFALRGKDQNTQSKEKLKDLESTLSRFAKILKERGCDDQLGIVLKEPTNYQLEDVLSVTESIQKNYRDAENVKTTMGVIRKFFRKSGEHHGQLSRLLKFVPNDNYGAIILGGFTLIIGAAGRADKLRTVIYETLAKIPLKLSEVQELAEVHYRSGILQMHADAVFVSIFVTLEKIVNELTKNVAKKGISLLFKGDRHGFDVTEAIQAVESSLEEFRIQVGICSEQRFGRMDMKMTRSMLAAESCEEKASEMVSGLAGLSQQVVSLSEQLEGFKKRHAEAKETHKQLFEAAEQPSPLRLSDGTQEEEQKEIVGYSKLQVDVFNHIYMLLTASPAFDSNTGKIDLQRALAMRTERESAAARRNHKAVSALLRLLKPTCTTVDSDLREAFDGAGTMSAGDVEKIQFALTSDAMYRWLKLPRSNVLLVECQTFPVTIPNPITYVTAYLTKMLREKEYPTTAFFCGLQANTSMDKRKSGPIALIKSLLAQLLLEVEKKRPTTHIAQTRAFVKNGESLKDVNFVFDCLHRFLSLIDSPTGGIFILIDSAVYLTGSDAENSEILRLLLSLTRDSKLMVKILITGVFSVTTVHGLACEVLYVPDDIPGGGIGFDPNFLEESMLESFGEFELLEDNEEEKS
ncbi:unnamed protein product [Periconia digitata]|uniref:Uncharacterized protein n=1 Tax=Periconia digitata TaxID=1303443 RepID=A0A9W4XZC1_9PLEO|nr:unnamed protein product [Periconia digitata]